MQQKDHRTIFKRQFTLSTTSMNKDMPLSTKTNHNFIRIDFFYLNKNQNKLKRNNDYDDNNNNPNARKLKILKQL